MLVPIGRSARRLADAPLQEPSGLWNGLRIAFSTVEGLERRLTNSAAASCSECNDSARRYVWRDVTGGSGELLAIEAVYKSSWLALTRLAYLLVGDRSEAEDIVQTVFVRAAPRWASIEEPAAYLRKAVVNLARDVHRRSFKSAAATMQPTAPIGEPHVDEAWRFVQALPTIQRAVVVLHIYEDLSLIDIASMLGRPASTVRSDLRRALATLRGSMV